MTVSIAVDIKDKSLAIKYAEHMYWRAMERGDRVKRITINGEDAFNAVFWYSKFLRG
jgi:hypothetical protein